MKGFCHPCHFERGVVQKEAGGDEVSDINEAPQMNVRTSSAKVFSYSNHQLISHECR